MPLNASLARFFFHSPANLFIQKKSLFAIFPGKFVELNFSLSSHRNPNIFRSLFLVSCVHIKKNSISQANHQRAQTRMMENFRIIFQCLCVRTLLCREEREIEWKWTNLRTIQHIPSSVPHQYLNIFFPFLDQISNIDVGHHLNSPYYSSDHLNANKVCREKENRETFICVSHAMVLRADV